MSQVLAMAQRLQESEKTVAELQAALERANRSCDQESSRLSEHEDDDDDDDGVDQDNDTMRSGDINYSDLGTEPVWNHEAGISPDQGSTPEQRLISDLSLDGDGKVCYHTIFMSSITPAKFRRTALLLRTNFRCPRPIALFSDWQRQQAVVIDCSKENLIFDSAGIKDMGGICTGKRLHADWNSSSPHLKADSDSLDMGDMAIGGPCYSPFLLTVMTSHAARFDSTKISEMLVNKARFLLGTEIHRPSSVPTAQALLQLSARDLAYGSTSQAWLYSGMAFRMVSDLGLHHSTVNIASLGHLSTEDLEIRRRLFWSCYFWDKAISLFFGRTPVLLELPFNHSPDLAHHNACRAAADNIEKLLQLLEKTFGFTRISYLIAYCVYTAASVVMQDVKNGNLDANAKMQTFLHCLRQGTTTCPIVQRSLDIITNRLRSENVLVPQAVPEDISLEQSASMASNYLPAFPYHDAGLNYSQDMNQGDFSLDNFTLLDSFPEAQYNSSFPGGEWFFTSI
ncbi:hypothetical protein IL306_005288 [Fusarium sp. DS 682]|nr:hypothetical protein IL306_005288 [Fusarium sp. DS 682]